MSNKEDSESPEYFANELCRYSLELRKAHDDTARKIASDHYTALEEKVKEKFGDNEAAKATIRAILEKCLD